MASLVENLHLSQYNNSRNFSGNCSSKKQDTHCGLQKAFYIRQNEISSKKVTKF